MSEPDEIKYCDDFRMCRLGDVAHIEMGQSPDSRFVFEDPYVGYPFLQGNAEFGVVSPYPKFGCIRPAKLAKKNDVLISVRAPVGAVNIADRVYCIGRGLAGIRMGGIEPNLAAQLIQRQSGELRRVAQGTIFEAVSKTDLQTLQLRLPPDAELNAIAQVLKSLDTAIQQTEAIVAKLKQVKQGLLHDLLTRGLDANGELRPSYEDAPDHYQASKLGWIPRAWTVGSLSANCSEVIDCPHSTPVFTDAGVLVARTMHIKDGVFLEDQASRVSEKQYRERVARLAPAAGDVIFTREAPVGEAFVIPADMKVCLGQRVMLLRPRVNVLSALFLLAQIYSGAVNERIGTLTSGTTNPHLNVFEVRDFMIPLPPYAEQLRIDDRIDAVSNRLSKEVRSLLKLKLQKIGLMDDLLTGRVRVTPLLAQ